MQRASILEANRCGFESWLCHLLPVGQWAGGLRIEPPCSALQNYLFNKFIHSRYLLNAHSVWHCAVCQVCDCNNHVCLPGASGVPRFSPSWLLAFTLLPLGLLLISHPLSSASATTKSYLSGINWCADEP